IDFFENALISIGGDGAILSVLRPSDKEYTEKKQDAGGAGGLARVPEGCYLLPGFVDLHIHAPQYPQLGTALDVPLEVWLQRHTLPPEARYADRGCARTAYGALVGDLIAHGTTTAVYYATIHQEATRLLV